MSNYGQVIREFRAAAGLSQKGLAEGVQMSTAYVGQVERGLKELSTERLAVFATALGVTPRRIKTRATKLAAAPAQAPKKNGKTKKSAKNDQKVVAQAPKKRKLKVVTAES